MTKKIAHFNDTSYLKQKTQTQQKKTGTTKVAAGIKPLKWLFEWMDVKWMFLFLFSCIHSTFKVKKSFPHTQQTKYIVVESKDTHLYYFVSPNWNLSLHTNTKWIERGTLSSIRIILCEFHLSSKFRFVVQLT